jgi:DNA-directed RNA polymerase subunit omega
MIYPSADEIDKQVESKYALVIMAAKRAKQLKEGHRTLIATESTNPLTVALEEIAAGAVRHTFDENSLAGQEALADQEAVVGARDLDVEGLDPLALPDDLVARAASALGADLSDEALAGDEDLKELVGGTDDDEIEEEEEDPLGSEDEGEGSEI